MGRRSRRRGDHERPPEAPESVYSGEHGELALRGALSVGSRSAYAQALAPGQLSRADAEQRALELLFEKLAVRWTVAGVPSEGQRELLGRLRLASPQERRWVRETLREHCAEHFPDVQVP